MKVLFYFEWEGTPAVIVETADGASVKGFFLGDDGTWTQATIPQLLDFLKEGREVPQEEFEGELGVIGQSLPALPM
jgi:hypothetical protein